jgi:hypothetical protein
LAGRIASWLRKIMEDPGRMEKCTECRRRFRDKEPGAWTSYRDFPELCNSMCSRDRRSHVNCRACGPYCPACAARIEGELLANREAYGG